MRQFPLPIIGFSGFSGSGKTTLLEKVIPQLKAKGLRIGLLKHSHHHIEMDTPTKDSYRLRYAGSDQLLLATKERHLLFFEYSNQEQDEPDLLSCLQQFDTNHLDLILIEGFRDAAIPKIEIHRPELNKPLLYETDKEIISIATPVTTHLPSTCSLTRLDLNQSEQVVDFILKQMKISVSQKTK